MKTYKRTRIIASLALLSSLTLTGVTFAATDVHPTKTNSSISRSIGARNMKSRTATSTQAFKKRENASNTPQLSHRSATSTPTVVGTVTAITSNSFTVVRAGHPQFTINARGKSASTTPVRIIPATATTTYTVNVTSGTTYMKNGKLDSLTDVTVGSFVTITGTLDVNTNTITALGVHLIDKPSKALKNGSVKIKGAKK